MMVNGGEWWLMMVNDGYISGWLLSPTPLNNMSSSVGMMMTFPIYGKITFMFQTTNQVYIGPWF